MNLKTFNDIKESNISNNSIYWFNDKDSILNKNIFKSHNIHSISININKYIKEFNQLITSLLLNKFNLNKTTNSMKLLILYYFLKFENYLYTVMSIKLYNKKLENKQEENNNILNTLKIEIYAIIYKEFLKLKILILKKNNSKLINDMRLYLILKQRKLDIINKNLYK